MSAVSSGTESNFCGGDNGWTDNYSVYYKPMGDLTYISSEQGGLIIRTEFIYKYTIYKRPIPIPYSTYYKPMMYYKLTPLFRSKLLYRYRTLVYGNSHYKFMMYYKPTPLFRADVREIAHGLIIRTIQYKNLELKRGGWAYNTPWAYSTYYTVHDTAYTLS